MTHKLITDILAHQSWTSRWTMRRMRNIIVREWVGASTRFHNIEVFVNLGLLHTGTQKLVESLRNWNGRWLEKCANLTRTVLIVDGQVKPNIKLSRSKFMSIINVCFSHTTSALIGPDSATLESTLTAFDLP
jgi:hypothetical protein